jgi:hypothetical protein
VRVDWVAVALVGLVNVVLMRPLSHYQFWWHWLGGRGWLLGYLAYALTAAATGVLSYGAARAAGWLSAPHGLLQAILAALAGAALLRADVGHPFPKDRQKAANLAAPLVNWLGVGLDHAARRHVETWARDLQDGDLAGAAGLLASDAGRPGSTVKRAMINASVRALNGTKRDYARGELVGLIAHGYLETDRTRG